MEIIMGKDIVINKRGTGMIPILFSCMETSFVFGSDIKITHSFRFYSCHYIIIKFIMQCITYEFV